MSEEKKAIRKHMILLRDSLSEETRKEADKLIRERFSDHFRDDLFGKKEQKILILLYASARSEVDTFLLRKSLLDRAEKSGRRILFAYPKVEGPRKMTFYQVRSEEDLQPAFHGIKEPVTKETVTEGLMRECFTLLVMPGVAFDEELNRMGYGGGYYDTFLEAYGSFLDVRAALAYEIQITEWPLFTEPHDQRPDLIVTEKRLLTPYVKYDKID